MTKLRRTAKMAAKLTAVVVILLMIGYFGFRNKVLEIVITKIQNKVQTEYDSRFTVEKASFYGISGVSLQNVALVPYSRDTIFRIQKHHH